MAYTKQQKREHVRELQGYLNSISYFDESMPKIIPDGFYGKETTAAVKIFQSKHGLPSTGNTDAATWNKVVETYKRHVTAAPEPLKVFPKSCDNIKKGDSGLHVYAVQSLLAVISKKYSDLPKVTVNGIFDDETENTVRHFQKAVRFKQTGIVSLALWNMMVRAAETSV